MNKIVPFERNVEYLNRRAALNRREGRLLDALSLFRRAVEREPGNPAHRMDMAETLCEMGCYTESNRVLVGMLPFPDAPNDCYFGLCCNYFGMNDLDRAYRAMVQFLACDPDAMKRGEVSSMFKNLVLARALNEAKNRRAVRVTRLLSDANDKLKRGELAAVEVSSRRALKLGIKRQLAGVLLAQALFGQGRTREAARAIAQALRIGRPQIRTLLTAVKVYHATGDGVAARAAYARMKPASDDEDGRRLLLEAACVLGDDERVRALLPRALGAAPYDRALLHMCAVNRVREGRAPEQALSFWTRMLLIEPTDPVARYYARKVDSGQLNRNMKYEYALPDEERARRAQMLTHAQWLSGAQVREAWRKPSFKEMLTWAVRSDERREVLLAQALLRRVDGDDARALLCEGMLDRGVGAPDATVTWPIKGNGSAVMTISGGPSGARLPVGLRKAMKLAIGRARPMDGELPAAVVKLALERPDRMARMALPRGAVVWAAALLYMACEETGRAIPLSAACAMMGCSVRRVARRVRLLGGGSEEARQ